MRAESVVKVRQVVAAIREVLEGYEFDHLEAKAVAEGVSTEVFFRMRGEKKKKGGKGHGN